MTEENQGTENSGGDGGEQTSFLDGIQSEDLRGHESISGFADLDSLAQGYVDMKGAQPITPESVEGYTFEVPEGVMIDDAGVDAFKAVALEAGMTAEQYSAAVKYRVSEVQKLSEAVTEQREKAVSDMRSEWGDSYEDNLQKGKKVLAASGAGSILATVFPEGGESLLGNNPEFAKMLVWVHDKMSPDTFESGSGGSSGAGKSAAEVLYPDG